MSFLRAFVTSLRDKHHARWGKKIMVASNDRSIVGAMDLNGNWETQSRVEAKSDSNVFQGISAIVCSIYIARQCHQLNCAIPVWYNMRAAYRTHDIESPWCQERSQHVRATSYEANSTNEWELCKASKHFGLCKLRVWWVCIWSMSIMIYNTESNTFVRVWSFTRDHAKILLLWCSP